VIRRARVLAALGAGAAALVVLGVLHSLGGTGPPLYDGVCLPPQYLTLGASPGPGSASATYTADQLNQTQELATGETTPQAQVIIAAGSFTVPAGATVTVALQPVPAPAVRPPDGRIAGNVYQLSARASTGQAIDLVAGHPPTVVLGAPSSGGPQLTLERFDGTAWTGLKTFQSGCGNTYEAAAPSLGMFALVAAGGSPSTPTQGTPPAPGPPVVLIVIVVALVLLALLIVATRLSRRRR
jgi:hypothetical protein